MKTPRRCGVGVRMLLVAALTLTIIGCKKKAYRLLSPDTVRQTPPFTVKVDAVTVVDTKSSDLGFLALLSFQSSDGRRLAIGNSKNATLEMRRFVESFQVGKTYTFPQALIDYEKTNSIRLE